MGKHCGIVCLSLLQLLVLSLHVPFAVVALENTDTQICSSDGEDCNRDDTILSLPIEIGATLSTLRINKYDDVDDVLVAYDGARTL